MTRFRCCKCDREYKFALMVSKKGDDPLIKCPGCGLVHSVNFEESKYEPVGTIEELRLKNYFINAICDSILASDDAGPGTTWITEDRLNHDTADYFWLGVRVWNSDSREPIASNFVISIQKDGGGFVSLAASDLAAPGTGNMVYTDLTPPNADWFCDNACGGTLEADGYAQDNGDTITGVDIQEDYEVELWWAFDPAGCAAGSLYEFGLTDNNAQFADDLLAASLDMASADVNVSCTVVGFTFADYQAAVNAKINIQADVVAFTLATYQAGVNAKINIDTSLVELTFATFQAGVSLGINVDASVVPFTLATYQATVNAKINIDASLVAFTLATYQADVSLGVNIDASVVGLTLAEHQATVNAKIDISAGNVALTLADYQADVKLNANVQADVVALTFAEYQATITAPAPPAALRKKRGFLLGVY